MFVLGNGNKLYKFWNRGNIEYEEFKNAIINR